jgi:serine/threonine-protein kinase
MDERQAQEQIPQSIGRYQILGSIGYGAMGAVYKAFDPLIKRTLAIKTIRLDIPRQSPQYKNFIERFYHEARISGTLSHPNIVTLFDIGEENGVPYLAMEFVEGETIASLVEKGVRFPPEKVINLVSQVASALDYAHSRGVIHRDIKPSNLILFEGERVKVTDFGIAKLADAEMTQSGTLLGTPSYMSPEQAMGDKLDGRTDIFSLGVCSFEMLSGEQPFPGTNVTSILYKLVHVAPIEPADLEMNGLVPQKWHEVFGKVLAKKPDDRYQTATEFVQDLEYCLGAWFGAAMGEDTRTPDARPAPEVKSAPEPDATRPLTKRDAPVEVTRVLTPPPAAAPSAESTRALPAVTPRAAPPPAPAAAVAAKKADEEMATVVMKAQPEAPAPQSVGKTVVMTAAQMASAVAPPAPKNEATVVLSAPVSDHSVKASTANTSSPTLRTSAPPQTIRADAPTLRPVPAPPRAAAPPPPDAPVALPTSAASPSTPRAGIPVGLVLGGGAFVFVLALIVAAVLLLRHRDPGDVAPTPDSAPASLVASPTAAPPATTVPQAARGVLHVESQPPGATVTIAGNVKGTTPLDVGDLPLGILEVRFELQGYETRTQSVALTGEAPQAEVKVTLAKPMASLGLVDVLSTPFGAEVRIDGTRAGQTPLTDVKLKPGVHQFEVEKEGHEPYSASVKIEAGKRQRVDALLRADQRAAPAPTPANVVDPDRIYLESEVDQAARKLSGNTAQYPENAPRLRSGESASVTVSFVVTEAGDVGEVKVAESGGRLLDEAVARAIQAWKFSPATKAGIKVKQRLSRKFTFRAG